MIQRKNGTPIFTNAAILAVHPLFIMIDEFLKTQNVNTATEYFCHVPESGRFNTVLHSSYGDGGLTMEEILL